MYVLPGIGDAVRAAGDVWVKEKSPYNSDRTRWDVNLLSTSKVEDKGEGSFEDPESDRRHWSGCSGMFDVRFDGRYRRNNF